LTKNSTKTGQQWTHRKNNPAEKEMANMSALTSKFPSLTKSTMDLFRSTTLQKSTTFPGVLLTIGARN
jgi:hypothetical protein